MPRVPLARGAAETRTPQQSAAPSALHPPSGDLEDVDLPLPEASRDFPAFPSSFQGLAHRGSPEVP